MKQVIHIFKSLEEQEQFHLENRKRFSAKERFINLYFMQQVTQLLHPVKDSSRKIIIRNGHS